MELKELQQDNDGALSEIKYATSHTARKKLKLENNEQKVYDLKDNQKQNDNYFVQLKMKEI